MRCLFWALVGTIALPAAGESQTATAPSGAQPAQPVFSMGQPPRWLPYISAFAVASHDAAAGGAGLLGVERYVLNPITGLLAVSGEVLGTVRDGRAAMSGRALADVPALNFGLGADWDFTRHSLAPVLAFQTALRRGGLFGHGSMLRLDWLPTRHQRFDVGVQLPVMQPFAGRTRPRRISAPRPRALQASTATPSAASITPVKPTSPTTLDAAARTIAAYVSLYTAADESTLFTSAPATTKLDFESAMRTYHASLATEFGVASRDSARAAVIATHARAAMLDEAILPYDALFGQVKDDAVFDVMLANARVVFGRWISDSSGLAAGECTAVLDVFDRWRGALHELYEHLQSQAKDSRLVWMAPQLALTVEQYDEQSEVDGLIGRAVGQSFTDHNALGYLRTADLTVEIARSIIAARRYHVLWTHDFTGRRPSGALDDIAYTMVADAYLPALTAAVQRYDSAGTFPQYFVLLDAFYYHGRAGALWMTILENPLGATIHLRKDEGRQAAHLRERLAALQAAVAHSTRLQREAAAHGGRRWLGEVVKVHVNVVLPSDFSFRSTRLVPPIPFMSDNVSRDHRKLVLYDFTETDPYAGEVLAAGIGIGEHYASATWEDRGYRLRGPGALEARDALRRTLAANGFRDDQIPLPLRAATGPMVPPDTADARRDVARVLQVHNEPGFGDKRSSVARAMLYSLAPAGSVIIVPDPLWLSTSWAGMLAGAAARGSTVIIIAPAKANAPSPEAPVIALERDVTHRLLELQHRLAALPDEHGGALHVGLYASETPVTNVAGRLAEVRAGLSRAPWIREVVPFDSTALAVLNRATASAAPADAAATSRAQDETPRAPQLHQKTQLIARPGAIATLLRQPGWETVLAQAMRDQARQTMRLSDAIGSPLPPADTTAARAADTRLQGYQRALTPAERKLLSFYFTVGSQNHDPRGLMLDGEVSVIVSGFDASVGLVDLFYLMTRTTWVESAADIDRLVPPPSGLMTRVGHLAKAAM